jgi:hypothetical protein
MPSRCAAYCSPCRPLLRAVSGWILSPPPTRLSHIYRTHPATHLTSLVALVPCPESRGGSSIWHPWFSGWADASTTLAYHQPPEVNYLSGLGPCLNFKLYLQGEIDVCENRDIILFWWLVVRLALTTLGMARLRAGHVPDALPPGLGLPDVACGVVPRVSRVPASAPEASETSSSVPGWSRIRSRIRSQWARSQSRQPRVVGLGRAREARDHRFRRSSGTCLPKDPARDFSSQESMWQLAAPSVCLSTELEEMRAAL